MRSTWIALFGLLAITASVNAAALNAETELASTIDMGTALRMYYNAFKRIMPCGVPSMHIPVLAPYVVDNFSWDYSNDFIRTKGSFSNMVITGLNNFQILDLNYNSNESRLSVDMMFKEIQKLAEYSLNSTLYFNGYPINWAGDGVLNTKIQDYRIVGDYIMAPNAANPNGLEIVDIKIHVYLGDVIVNNWNNEWDVAVNNFVNRWSREYAILLVEEMQPYIADLYKQYVLPQLNEVMKDTNMQDIISYLMEQTIQLEMSECNAK